MSSSQLPHALCDEHSTRGPLLPLPLLGCHRSPQCCEASLLMAAQAVLLAQALPLLGVSGPPLASPLCILLTGTRTLVLLHRLLPSALPLLWATPSLGCGRA